MVIGRNVRACCIGELLLVIAGDFGVKGGFADGFTGEAAVKSTGEMTGRWMGVEIG